MRLGTRSVLFGAHCFFIHPFFVAAAWRKLYGFPWDPRLWFAFFIHDIGYLGKPNMDGPEGERHPIVGATIMGKLFGQDWHDLCLYHSRFFAKKNGEQFSRLCIADKYATVITPAWLYLPMVNWTGEIKEYMKLADTKYSNMNMNTKGQRAWFDSMVDYLGRWVQEFKGGGNDTWTPKE